MFRVPAARPVGGGGDVPSSSIGEPPLTEAEIPIASAPVGAANEPPWTEIRAAYEGSNLTVAAIARAYGITTDRLWTRARRDDWPRRRSGAGETNRPTPAEPLDRRVLVGRLFKAVERQIAEVECRFDGSAPPSLDEKDARTLAALARTLELLIGLEKQAGRDDSEPEPDIDEFRLDLARRLESLRRAD